MWHNDTSLGQRKKLSPWQETNPWPPENRAGALSTELQKLIENKVIKLRSYNMFYND